MTSQAQGCSACKFMVSYHGWPLSPVVCTECSLSCLHETVPPNKMKQRVENAVAVKEIFSIGAHYQELQTVKF